MSQNTLTYPETGGLFVRRAPPPPDERLSPSRRREWTIRDEQAATLHEILFSGSDVPDAQRKMLTDQRIILNMKVHAPRVRRARGARRAGAPNTRRRGRARAGAGGKFAFDCNLPSGGQTRLLRPNRRAILNCSSILYGSPKRGRRDPSAPPSRAAESVACVTLFVSHNADNIT